MVESDPVLQHFFGFFAFCFGLTFGSFFNVCIWRIPRGESIISPGSHCPNCGRGVKSYENIPVFSFIFLRGKCAGCKLPISLQYPLIELLTGLYTLLLWYTYILPALQHSTGWQVNLPLAGQTAVLLLLVVLSVIDIKHYILPDVITLPLLGLGIGLSFLPGSITPLQACTGLIAGGGTLLMFGKMGEIVFRKDEGMGGGDIKLLAVFGAFWGWKAALLAILFGSFIGAFLSLAAIPLKLLPKDRKIPFGPYLAAGLLIALYFGETLISWYLSIIERSMNL